jgi:hypothetical protein
MMASRFGRMCWRMARDDAGGCKWPNTMNDLRNRALELYDLRRYRQSLLVADQMLVLDADNGFAKSLRSAVMRHVAPPAVNAVPLTPTPTTEAMRR